METSTVTYSLHLFISTSLGGDFLNIYSHDIKLLRKSQKLSDRNLIKHLASRNYELCSRTVQLPKVNYNTTSLSCIIYPFFIHPFIRPIVYLATNYECYCISGVSIGWGDTKLNKSHFLNKREQL